MTIPRKYRQALVYALAAAGVVLLNVLAYYAEKQNPGEFFLMAMLDYMIFMGFVFKLYRWAFDED